MNPDLKKLQSYPFEKLAQLKAGITPPIELEHIALSIGEPKHKPPQFVLNCLVANIDCIANYPSTKGLATLRQSISNWCQKRFKLKPNSLDPNTAVLPVNGTREALFALAQAVVERSSSSNTASTETETSKNTPLVISPNPFYQIYEGAAYLAGAEPFYLNCTAENNFLPDFDRVPNSIWTRCQLLFLCSPGNPTGAIINTKTYQKLIRLADKFNFIIASDECYSELYFDEQNPPVGLLQACAEIGRNDYKRCIVFHSLSKRSNLPGLRSGFVAGCSNTLQQFLLYRTYHGSAMPVATQLASIVAWNDETHVKKNRDLYREKFDAVLEILDGVLPLTKPDASFYLWAKTPIEGTLFAQGLFAQQNITALPGSYIARATNDTCHNPSDKMLTTYTNISDRRENPGKYYVRLALVAELDQCIEAAQRIKKYIASL